MMQADPELVKVLREILTELKKIESSIDNVAFGVEQETRSLLDYAKEEKKELDRQISRDEKRVKPEDAKKPATEKQLAYLSDLTGIPVEDLRSEGLTQQRASAAIQDAISRGAKSRRQF